MYNASQAFKNAQNQLSRKFYAKIVTSGGTTLDNCVKSIKWEYGSNAEDGLMIGGTVSGHVTVVLENPGYTVVENEGITPYIGLMAGSAVEYVPLGFFTVDSVTKNGGDYSIEAYDRMYTKAEQKYVSTLTYPSTTKLMLNEMCNKMGISMTGYSAFTGKTFRTKPEGYTIREMIGLIAQLHGCFAGIDRSGNLKLSWYENNATSYANRYNEPEVTSPANYTLNKIEVTVGEGTTISAGSGSVAMSFQNPYMTQTFLNAVMSDIGGFSYRGGEIDLQIGDILLDPWDTVTIDGMKFPCMEIVQEYDGGVRTKITSHQQTEFEAAVSYKSPTAVQFEKQYSALEAAIKYATETITGAHGGNVITNRDAEGRPYEVIFINAPTADTATQWLRVNSAGIGFSTDGTTYTTAWTIDGHFNADFITSGTLSANRIAAGSINVTKLANGNLDNLCTIIPSVKSTWRSGNTVDAGYDDEGNAAIKTTGSQLYLTTAAARWGIFAGDTVYVKAKLYAASNVDVNIRVQSHKADLDDIIGRANKRVSLSAGWNDVEASIALTEDFFAGDVVRYNIGIIPFNASVEIRASAFYAQIARSAELIVDGTITADKIAANAIITGKIADGAVTAGKIPNAEITGVKIADNAITAGKIAANAVTADKIAASSITADKISIGNFENFMDENPEDAATWDSEKAASVTAPDGTKSFKKKTETATNFWLNKDARSFNLSAGDQIYFKMLVYVPTASSDGNTDFRIIGYNESAEFVAQNHYTLSLSAGWNEVEGTLYLNNTLSGSVKYRLLVYQQPGHTTQVHVASPYAQVKRSGEMIVDGTLTASKIKADEVLTQHLTATDLDIKGGSVDIETASTSDSKIKLRSSSYETGMKATGVSAKVKSGDTVTVEASIDANNGITLRKSSGFESGINPNVIGGSNPIGGTGSPAIPPSVYAKDETHMSYISPTEGKIDGNNIATQPWAANAFAAKSKSLKDVGNGKRVRFTFPSGASGYGRAVFVWTSKYSKSASTGGNWNSDGLGIMANSSAGTECTLIGEASGKLVVSARTDNTLEVTNNSGHSGRYDIIILDVNVTAEIIN